MTFRHLAPAGSPIGAVDLVRWAERAVSRRDVVTELRDEITRRFGVRHVFLTSTGRAGMTVLLGAFRRLAPPFRDEVIIPSYTCYSVAASVLKAGLRVRIVDIDPETLDYSASALAAVNCSRVLAIVATNLYGLPNNMPSLEAFAASRGLFLIDDAAQALNGRVAGKWCGTWGDAGLFSFDKGKNVSAIDGGIIVTNSDALAAALNHDIDALPDPPRNAAAINVSKAIAYFLMLRPWLYGVPASIPQLGLGKTAFTTQFPLEQPSRVLVALGRTMIDRLDAFTTTRRENAAVYTAALASVRGVRAIRPLPSAEPAYLRFPVLAAADETRERVFGDSRRARLGVTGSYPASIADLPEFREHCDSRQNFAGGRLVARRIMTLPTHPLVTRNDILQVTRLVEQAHEPTLRSTPLDAQIVQARRLQ